MHQPVYVCIFIFKQRKEERGEDIGSSMAVWWFGWRKTCFVFYNHVYVHNVPMYWLSCLRLAHNVIKQRQGSLLLGLTM